jgi:hypothetical protein
MERRRAGGAVVAVIAVAMTVAGCTNSAANVAGSPKPSVLGAVSSPLGLPVPAASATPKVKPSQLPLPALAAATYPESVYPPPTTGRKGAVLECPGTRDLEPPTAGARRQAVRIAEHFQSGSRSRVLHTADRAIWSQLYTPRQERKYGTTRPHHQPVLSSGPLLGRYSGGGAPNPAGWVRHDCPPRVARDSYEVAIGPRDGPALDGVFVFVERRGHVLLYFEYP